MYATNTRASKDMIEKLTKMKRKIDKYVIWDFTASLSVIDGTRRQKVSKDIKIRIILSTNLIQQTFIKQYLKQWQNIFFFQVHMEHSPKETIRRAIKQCPHEFKTMKLSRIHSLTKLKLLETGNIKISENL